VGACFSNAGDFMLVLLGGMPPERSLVPGASSSSLLNDSKISLYKAIAKILAKVCFE
jgi:hypothetical protein